MYATSQRKNSRSRDFLTVPFASARKPQALIDAFRGGETEGSTAQSSRFLRRSIGSTQTPKKSAKILDVCRAYLAPETRRLGKSREPSRRSQAELTTALQDKIDLDLKYAALKAEWKQVKAEHQKLAKTPATVQALEKELARLLDDLDSFRCGRVLASMNDLKTQLNGLVNS